MCYLGSLFFGICSYCLPDTEKLYIKINLIVWVYFLTSISQFFIVQFSKYKRIALPAILGGHKWTRTTDLTLIRRAL